jgi:hypothetical protein
VLDCAVYRFPLDPLKAPNPSVPYCDGCPKVCICICTQTNVATTLNLHFEAHLSRRASYSSAPCELTLVNLTGDNPIDTHPSREKL